MEAQLVQQRLALQQKRMLESGQGSKLPNKVTLTSNPKNSKICSVTSTTSSTSATVTKISLISPSTTTTATTPSAGKNIGVRRIFTSRTTKPDGKSLASLTTTSGKVPITTTILPKTPLVVRTPNIANSAAAAGTRPTVLTLGGQIVRPSVVQNPTTPAAPVRTQIQLIQGPNGQLQVRGLLPGQQLIRLSDGRLQLLTLPTVQQAQTEQPAVQPAQASPAVQLPTLRPAISLAPTASVSTGGAVATLTSAAPSTPMSISMPAIASIAAPGTIQLVQGQTTQIKFQSPVAISPNLSTTTGATATTTPAATKLIQIRPQTQARPVAPANQQVRLQTPVAIPGIGTVVQPTTPTATTQVAVPANQTQTSTSTNKILLPSTPVKVSSPETKQIITSPTKVVTVSSKDGSGTQQFVLTNAIKQQSMFFYYLLYYFVLKYLLLL
jgi:hypothetical protein